jgi:hypothetical protein
VERDKEVESTWPKSWSLGHPTPSPVLETINEEVNERIMAATMTYW